MNEISKVVIAGDLCIPASSSYHSIINHGFTNILNHIKDSDFSLVNLEGPITNSSKKIRKYGPHHRMGYETASFLSDFRFSAVNLCNNHIMDYGNTGLSDTLHHLNNRGIEYLGAGNNSSLSYAVLIKKINGLSIAFISFAEHEFSCASKTRSGAIPFDYSAAYQAITQLKLDKNDFIIVLYHGGPENVPYPTPGQQNRCRYLLDIGADAIVCQHSHCIGAVEIYNNKTIIYGQGNFLFPKCDSSHTWRSGMLVNFYFRGASFEKFELTPFTWSPDYKSLFTVNTHSDKHWLKMHLHYSKVIHSDVLLQKEWDDLCLHKINFYMSVFSLRSKIKVYLEKIIPFAHRIHGFEIERIENILRCQTHHEILCRIIAFSENPPYNNTYKNN